MYKNDTDVARTYLWQQNVFQALNIKMLMKYE